MHACICMHMHMHLCHFSIFSILAFLSSIFYECLVSIFRKMLNRALASAYKLCQNIVSYIVLIMCCDVNNKFVSMF